MTNSQPYELFAAASQLVRQQLLFDAMQQFLAITRHYPDHELADDALYNAGLCHFHMNSFKSAILIFRELIQNYPDATIYQDDDTREFGRTAAKAHYSIINCYLGLNNVEKAKAELALLSDFGDAYVFSAMNETISYKDLGMTAIQTFEQLK
jgi:tetratricopeptide (TPR) repeat protein